MYPRDDDSGLSVPVWAAFGDLMACLLGVFVLFFVWVVTFQVTLAHDLAHERAERVAATDRLKVLESALAGPLRAGLITLVDGRIGIRGSVLFDLNSADLRPEGSKLLSEMAEPLAGYLDERAESLMVSGFTDDLRIHGPLSPFRDNWELSTQRALTVVRTLVDFGVPHTALFAAGFGPNHPIAPNDDEGHRAQNRRVEVSAVPRPTTQPLDREHVAL